MGSQYTKVADIDVIVDEADMSIIGMAPNAEAIEADLLMYCKPSQLPTTNPRKLVADYMIYDAEYNDYFIIVDASMGKNQDTGVIEHAELLLKQTDIAIDGAVSA